MGEEKLGKTLYGRYQSLGQQRLLEIRAYLETNYPDRFEVKLDETIKFEFQVADNLTGLLVTIAYEDWNAGDFPKIVRAIDAQIGSVH